MKSNEIRSRFLEFFRDRGHEVVASSSLVPADDPTLLFVNAGMNQFRDVFLGTQARSYARAATVQKCVRAGGKHNDLDMVGRTRRHHTFFEMLGNFSFGDYFKSEAVEYAWRLLTEGYGLPAERLWATVFREDDEAADLWIRRIGLPRERLRRMDEADNFWQMGDTGPCGPCSEIHYDFGPEGSETGHADCSFPCECGRYVEIWNLVFMQFNRNEDGLLSPLPRPSIDTGMGLERLAAVLQGKLSNYETDLLRPLIDEASRMFGVDYGASRDVDLSLRIIADHVRAAAFLISDGVLPSNEGRGYVLRKIMRRGMRQGALLGRREPFLHVMTGHVVELMKEAYPQLATARDYVARVVEAEERRFSATVSVAVARLEEIADQVRLEGGDRIPGADIFKLYDTYGLPLDFTHEIAQEKDLDLDLDGFNAELDRQRERARESWKGDRRTPAGYDEFLEAGPVSFLGYETTASRSRVRGILAGGRMVESLEGAGNKAEVILDRTPFYAESGGQVGDSGSLIGPAGAARVLDARSPVQGLIVHDIEIDFGRLAVGDDVEARVDADRRKRIAANHTGTHLLHAVLRDALGLHVKQAGSLVAPDRLRFDYTHYAPMTPAEIAEIEGRINRAILDNHPVVAKEMDLDQAIESGAIAFFGEKYQQRVRVISIPGVSIELCGGTHTRATGDIGMFKVVSEGGIAAGVRRIEALTGLGSYERLDEDEKLLAALAGRLRTSRSDLTGTVERLLEHQKHMESELDRLKRSSARSRIDGMLEGRRLVAGVPVIAQRVEGLDPALMRELAENVRSRLGSGVVVLGAADNGKATLVTAVSEDLRDRLHAGRIVKEVARIVGGGGGGRADFAQAGGKDPERLDQALQEVYNIVAGSVG